MFPGDRPTFSFCPAPIQQRVDLDHVRIGVDAGKFSKITESKAQLHAGVVVAGTPEMSKRFPKQLSLSDRSGQGNEHPVDGGLIGVLPCENWMSDEIERIHGWIPMKRGSVTRAVDINRDFADIAAHLQRCHGMACLMVRSYIYVSLSSLQAGSPWLWSRALFTIGILSACSILAARPASLLTLIWYWPFDGRIFPSNTCQMKAPGPL